LSRESLEDIKHGGVKQLSGRTIIAELLRNAELAQFDLAYSILLPAVFTVYLNPADHARLAGIFPLITEEGIRALRDYISQLNGKPRLFRSGDRKNAKQYKIARENWIIGFLPDPQVPEGDVEIHSELTESAEPGYRGAKTTLTGRDPSATVRREPPVSVAARTEKAASVYAEVHYHDDSGERRHFITQNATRVGRGGSDQPMDLALYAGDEVSREHLIIRRDPATGVFTISDCSTNGTWVDGRKLRRLTEEILPDRAEIRVSDDVTLRFEVRK
jgi:hypothetical protein